MKMIQFQIVKHYRDLSDTLYAYKKNVMEPALKNVQWQEIVPIDKILAIGMCRDQEVTSLLKAKEMIDHFIKTNKEI